MARGATETWSPLHETDIKIVRSWESAAQSLAGIERYRAIAMIAKFSMRERQDFYSGKVARIVAGNQLSMLGVFSAACWSRWFAAE